MRTLRQPSSPKLKELPASFLIYTPNIRNPRNRRRTNHLHFSNLYKSGAFSLRRLGDPLSASVPGRILPSPLSRSLRATGLLIFGRKIRNRRKPCRISNFRFSNLYAPPALSFPYLCSSVPARRGEFIYGFKGFAHRLPKAKAQRTLIYGTGINFSRNLLKTKDRHRA